MRPSENIQPGFVASGLIRGIAAALLMLCALAASAETVRSKADDLRLWQTVYDRTVPLAWPWEEGAESATLVFSNRVTHVVSSVTVSRTANEPRGECSPPVGSSGEAIVDVTLKQMAGAREIVCESASLAYVSGAGGGPITVRVSSTRDWRRFAEPRIFAFDPVGLEQSGDSGYDIAWPNCKGARFVFR